MAKIFVWFLQLNAPLKQSGDRMSAPTTRPEIMGLIPHFLEAEGTLAPWRDKLLADTRELESLFRRVLAPGDMPDVDVVIERVAGSGIPGIGLGGYSFRRGTMTIRLDPGDWAFQKSIDAGAFKRLVAHEFHHCLRHAGAGYGKTLGEAMVSEGLADYFVLEVLSGDPPIWSTAIAADDWMPTLTCAGADLASPAYNHSEWFYGHAGRWPRWAGYTIGFQLIEYYLADHPDILPSRMASTAAQVIIDYAWPRLLATHADRSAAA
jgi:hypothetical protein